MAGGNADFLQMGSYGLGMTRILAGGIEVLSVPNEIRWPTALAPFTVCIIPPKVFSILWQHCSQKILSMEPVHSNSVS